MFVVDFLRYGVYIHTYFINVQCVLIQNVNSLFVECPFFYKHILNITKLDNVLGPKVWLN